MEWSNGAGKTEYVAAICDEPRNMAEQSGSAFGAHQLKMATLEFAREHRKFPCVLSGDIVLG